MDPTTNSQIKKDSGPEKPSQSPTTPNVVIFGETGVGKSSVINMLAGEDIAETSGDALGQTFKNIRYTVSIPTQAGGTEAEGKKEIVMWDTAGLNEGELGRVSPEEAMQNIHRLAKELKDGLSLLVYVVSGHRRTSVMKTNYNSFVDGIAQQKVPVVLIVTGCENDTPMDKWWTENKEELDGLGLCFKGHECITSTRGKFKGGKHMFEEEYEESVAAVRRLVVAHLMKTAASVADNDSITRWFSSHFKLNATQKRDNSTVFANQPQRMTGRTAIQGEAPPPSGTWIHLGQLVLRSAAEMVVKGFV